MHIYLLNNIQGLLRMGALKCPVQCLQCVGPISPNIVFLHKSPECVMGINRSLHLSQSYLDCIYTGHDIMIYNLLYTINSHHT